MIYRWDIINERLSRFDPSRFLEIGVRHGRVGKRVDATEKLGVDPQPGAFAAQHYTHLFHQTSDEFFKDRKLPLNVHVVLIDGLHHADQVMRDVQNSLFHLHPQGTIILHDCKPQDEASQIVPQRQFHWNGDCWKVIVTLRATRSDLSVYTLDTDEGLGIVTRAVGDRALIPDPGELTWEKLVENRETWLGLVQP